LHSNKIHWEAVEADPRFKSLHSDKNKCLLRMMFFAMIYFFLLPISAAYFQDVLRIKIWGVVNVGLLFALSQFLVAWSVAALYTKRANAEFDDRVNLLVKDAHKIGEIS
jgi:uncharacterized membrane protein (DUF485 family)